jgi:hypothetical protein
LFLLLLYLAEVDGGIMKSVATKVFTLGISVLSLYGCGVQTEVTEIKEFKFFVYEDSYNAPEIKARLESLIADYNQELGFEALKYTDNEYEANSPIFISDNVYNPVTQHVGWGQWIAETHETKQMNLSGSTKINRDVHFKMRIEFDRGYFLSRMDAPAGSNAANDLKKLLAHEVGHGLQMDHNEKNVSDVMYPVISGTKDFDQYYQRVRAFFGH